MPTPIRWQVPVELSPEEARVAALLHRIGKFYVFLRTIRAELFDDAFQAELAAVYQPRGTAPLPAGAVGDGDRAPGLRPGQRCGSGRGRARGPALAIGAGLSGATDGALLPRRAGEIPRADDRARPRSEAARSHGGAGEADRPLRLAGLARGAGFVAAGGRGPRGGHVESAGARVADGGDVRRRRRCKIPRDAGAGRARA